MTTIITRKMIVLE